MKALATLIITAALGCTFASSAVAHETKSMLHSCSSSPLWRTVNPTWPTWGPKKTGQIIWAFHKPGEFDFACLIAGHYQAGMVGNITAMPDNTK